MRGCVLNQMFRMKAPLCAVFVAALMVGFAAPSSRGSTNHWAFEPIVRPAPPAVRDLAWCRTPIDRFILAKLEARGISPNGPAEPRTLIRRISFDLAGLPPAVKDVAEFVRVAEGDPELAGQLFIDRWLASPQYGERWGRWWLDVARYADTNGQDENKVMANAWRYRDWVIRAFNQNKPFDQFIIEQLAGDLLPPAASESEAFDRLVATGFLVLGPKMLAEQDKPKLVMDIVDEQIDTAGRAFLGLTLGCARCHDHKFDPVTARDYYAMAGIFKSTRTMADLAFVSKFNETVITPRKEREIFEAHEKEMKDVTDRIGKLVREANASLMEQLSVGGYCALPKDPRVLYPVEVRSSIEELEAKRDTLAKSAPAPLSYALAVTDDVPVDLPVHLRGSHLNVGNEPVPRGFIPAAFNKEIQVPKERSGRLELARWLTDPENPLTARVIVNRVWQAHFGEGLVRTPDNFGLRGEPPSHPELLDWLASELIRSGWDLKWLHRITMQSAVYQQSSRLEGGAERLALDPENRLLWRFPRRRLDAEMIRDSVLAVSGRLHPEMGGSLVDWKNNEYVPNDDISPKSLRRTIYLPIVRDRVFDALTIFDFANPSVCTAQRTSTVVSHQALFILNSPVVTESAEALAKDLCGRAEWDDATRIRAAYERVLSRPATETEVDRALRFLKAIPPRSDMEGKNGNRQLDDFAAFCQVLFASNEFIYRF